MSTKINKTNTHIKELIVKYCEESQGSESFCLRPKSGMEKDLFERYFSKPASDISGILNVFSSYVGIETVRLALDGKQIEGGVSTTGFRDGSHEKCRGGQLE